MARADERLECQLLLSEGAKGKVEVESPKGARDTFNEYQQLQPGDSIETGLESTVDLRLCDGSVFRLSENSRLRYSAVDFERVNFASWDFELSRGSLRAIVVGDGKGERAKLRIRTPVAVVGVKGTEFVLDVEDTGGRETALHTLEGEVLFGRAEDYERMAKLRGEELKRAFVNVSSETLSVLRANEKSILKPALFKLWEFRAERRMLFGKELSRKAWNEIRPSFQRSLVILKSSRQNRGLFQRAHEKIEEKTRVTDETALRQETIPKPLREAIQEGASTEAEKDLRRTDLERNLEENRSKTREKRERKGWRKNYQGGSASPRFPNLGR